MKRTQAAAADTVVQCFSPAMFRFFAWLFARNLSASFHAVRLLGAPPDMAGPLVAVVNHPSWWDAVITIWLSSTLFADRRCFAPMDAKMLARYRFFGRIGAFGIEAGSRQGAAHFLAVSERVLAEPDGMLIVNAQGRFSDVRERPISILPGLAHLARRVPGVTFVPLAIEYAFWDERRPNVLLRFGQPVSTTAVDGRSVSDVAAHLSDALEAAMNELSEASQTRDAGRFRTLMVGRVGINPFYDLWRRARALARGRRFSPAHGDRA